MKIDKTKQALIISMGLLLASVLCSCISRDYTRISDFLREGRMKQALSASRGVSRAAANDPLVIGITRALSAEISLDRLVKAQNLFYQNKFGAARDAARDALETNPGNLQGCAFMADVCCLDGIERYADEDFDGALKAYDEARVYCPNHPVAKKYTVVTKHAWSCRDYESGLKKCAENTKTSLKEAVSLFEEAEKRTSGFCDAAACAKECRERFAIICFAEARHMLTSGKTSFAPATALLLMEEGVGFCPSFKDDRLLRDTREIVRELAKVNFAFDFSGSGSSGYAERLKNKLANGVPGYELANSTFLPKLLFKRRWASTADRINVLRVVHGARSKIGLPSPCVEISVRLDKPSVRIEETGVKNLKSRYLHGSKRIPNPRKSELIEKIPKVAKKLNHLRTVEYPKQYAAEMVRRAVKERAGLLGGLVVGAVTKSLLDEILGDIKSTQAELQTLQAEYASAPDMITVEDIRSYSYRKSTVAKSSTFKAAVTINDPSSFLRGRIDLKKTHTVSDTRIRKAHGKDVEGIVNREPVLPSDSTVNDAAFANVRDELIRSLGGEIVTYHGRWAKRKGLEAVCMKQYLSREAGNKMTGTGDSVGGPLTAKLMPRLAPASSIPACKRIRLPKSWKAPGLISMNVSRKIIERYVISRKTAPVGEINLAMNR